MAAPPTIDGPLAESPSGLGDHRAPGNQAVPALPGSASGRVRVALLLLSAGSTMGLSMPLGKLAIQAGLTPLSFVLIPGIASTLLLAAIAAWKNGRPERPRQLLIFGLVAGLLGQALPNTLVAWLSAAAGASSAGLAYTLPPVFTLLYLLLLRVQAVNPVRIGAVVLGLAGAVWLALARLQGGDLSLFAAALLVAIPAIIGAGNVYRALRLPAGVPVEWLGAALVFGGVVWLAPIWWYAEAARPQLPPGSLLYLALQVLAASIGAVLFFALQRAAEPVTMSFVGYVMAVTAVLVGALVLGESLPWQLVPASLLIAAAFWLIAGPGGVQPRRKIHGEYDRARRS